MAFQIGHIPWDKGLKGIHLSPLTEFKKGFTEHDKSKHPMFDKKHSKETREHWSKIRKGKHFSPQTELRFDIKNGITLCKECHNGVEV